MLTDNERNTLAAALSLGLEWLPEAPDLGLNFNDRPAVLATCRALVDRMPEERARLYLSKLQAAMTPRTYDEQYYESLLRVARAIDQHIATEFGTAPRQPIIDVLTTPAIGHSCGTLTATPTLEQRPNGELYTDIDHDDEDPDYDADRYNRVREVVHLRTHDVVILACEREIVIMSSEEFHSQV